MLQPLLHDLVSTVLAPASALSGSDGQIRQTGVQGLFRADRRVLSLARLLVDGREPEAVGHAAAGTGRARFVSLARWLGDRTADPTVRLDRVRELTPYGMEEHVEIISTAAEPVTATVTVELACDFAAIETVKSGAAALSAWSGAAPFPAGSASAPFSAGSASAAPAVSSVSGDGRLTWRSEGTRGTVVVTVTGRGAKAKASSPAALLSWEITLPPRGRTTLSWSLSVHDPAAVVVPAAGPPEWSVPRVAADDRRIVRLLDQALADLCSLRLAEPGAPGDTFLGAGVPWFLTLFGRDSIWAARMLLPLGTRLAAGTLRVLARRQGERLDPLTGEAPGKIMHELRREEFPLGEDDRRLPAAYYGTIDATPLWISLLHDAWRWGMPPAEVEALLPHLEAALGWLADHADPDRDGFIEYVDTSGHGLANQGWKDSGDSVRFHDGGQAEPPIALAEVQGYACRAALDGAALLDAFGRPGAARWREYADALAGRFRAAFWVEGAHGRFPALALDRDKRPVDSLTSNIGHLLGTGLLSREESAQVADLLAGPGMAEGFGLRTMSSADRGFGPLSYHCGSIWPHDTAIVIAALAREGFDAQAAALAEGLLAAAESFGYRLPELYGGDARDLVGRPVAYPAACHPQAWSAAAALTIAHAALGLYPDVPSGRAVLRPLAGAALGALTVSGLRVAGHEVEVSVAHDATATVTGLPTGLRLERLGTPSHV
ncbi:glycogen debranching N-terminal domain-containing protein [Nonomuraea sp. SYSU D8015]|uniref:glycogen debranching N-terminal domain-containing protein n=1 Tax=Nonomuraea sp. SYSU D8015 TaxID=2593644 RepID=UPI001CB6FD40|nr:glycogen debranching N-terminal domain-containing protein [Nonomuraea sp. SYSU D8015]